MMRKVIIHIGDGVDSERALINVQRAISRGLLSGRAVFWGQFYDIEVIKAPKHNEHTATYKVRKKERLG